MPGGGGTDGGGAGGSGGDGPVRTGVTTYLIFNNDDGSYYGEAGSLMGVRRKVAEAHLEGRRSDQAKVLMPKAYGDSETWLIYDTWTDPSSPSRVAYIVHVLGHPDIVQTSAAKALSQGRIQSRNGGR